MDDADAAGEHRPERSVDRLELQLAQSRRRADGTPAPAEPLGETRPLAGHAVVDLAELPVDVRLVGVEREAQAMLPELAARPDGFEAGPCVAEDDERAGLVGQAEALRQ